MVTSDTLPLTRSFLLLLSLQRDLPDYFCKFLELCLMVTADHGPAVSGAHNTIVAARAGKDLVSALASGLLTIVSSSFTAVRQTLVQHFMDFFPPDVFPGSQVRRSLELGRGAVFQGL